MKKLRAAIAAPIFALMLMIILPGDAPAQAPPEQPDLTIDAAARAEVIEAVVKRLGEAYVFPDVAAKMGESLRKRAADKEYEQVTSAKEFAAKLTADLQAVSRDKHLRVRYSHRPIPPRPQQQREPTAE